MARAIDIPKGCKTKTLTFGGREWLVINVPWKTRVVDNLRANVTAHIDEDMGIIMFRSYNPDLAKIAVLHELLHFSFPALKEIDLHLGDSMLKSSLDAFGIDLSPLVEGYE